MPKYLIQANYVGEGIKGLLKDGGTGRRAAVEKLFGSVGGKMRLSTMPSAIPIFLSSLTCRTTSARRRSR